MVLSWATWIACRDDAGTGGDATRGTFSTLECGLVKYVHYVVHHLSGGIEVRAGKTAKGQAAAADEAILANGCPCPDFVAPGLIKLGSSIKRCRVKKRKEKKRGEKRRSEKILEKKKEEEMGERGGETGGRCEKKKDELKRTV